MKRIILKASNIDKTYFNKQSTAQVLRDISIDIEEGKITTIVGPSGAGKSTLLYLLGTLDLPTRGSISYFDEQLSELKYELLSEKNISEFRNQKIGFVFQFHHLLPEFDALENVMLPALILGEPTGKAKRKAIELLEIVGVADRAKHKAQQLSGGEQQRVAIARALINNPRILLADEPTGNLDSSNSTAFINLMLDLKMRFGTTFVVATHSNEVASIADRVVQMKNGSIV